MTRIWTLWLALAMSACSGSGEGLRACADACKATGAQLVHYDALNGCSCEPASKEPTR